MLILISHLLLSFGSSNQIALADPTPTPIPELQEKFAYLNSIEMPEVIVYGCSRDSKPCNGRNGNDGCVPEGLDEAATKKACDYYTQMLKETYKVACYGYVNAKQVFLGWTKDDTQCSRLQNAWNEVNALIAEDPALKNNSLEWRAGFFRNTLLDPRTKKDRAVVGNQLRFKKNGKAKRKQTRDMDQDRLMTMIWSNFDEYKEERHCGPGLLPLMDKVPVVNQRQQGTCFAHAANSMTDYVLRMQNARENKEYGSPLMIAIDYTAGTNNESCKSTYDPMNAGHTCGAFNASFKHGFCSSESIEKAIVRYSLQHQSPNDVDVKKWSKKLEKEFPKDFQKKLNSLESDKILRFLYLIGDLYEKREFANLRQIQTDLKRNGNPSGAEVSCIEPKIDGLFDPQWWLATSLGSLTIFYKTFFDGVCKREPYDFNATCSSKFFSRPKYPSENDLDTALQSRYPVGISYCANVLKNQSYTFKKIMKDGKETDDCERHASMIIGTALDDQGRCTYVVRNSWGTGCGYYDKDYTCKDGNIFVPKETLMKQIYGYDTLSVQ